jgi:hypothetical protein
MKLNPELMPKPYAFVRLPDGEKTPDKAIATFREKEGLSVILEKDLAIQLGWSIDFEAAWLVLNAETSLTDKGITAAFSKILTDNDISCNVFAPIHHDHIFVPWTDGEKALALLNEMEIQG